MDLIEEVHDDTRTARDAAAAGVALFAFVINSKGELNRYHRWLVEQGVLEDPAVPGPREYRDHLETTLAYFMGSYTELNGLLETAGRTAPGPMSACLTPGLAPGPGLVPVPGRERDELGTRVWPIGRRDGACLHPVR